MQINLILFFQEAEDIEGKAISFAASQAGRSSEYLIQELIYATEITWVKRTDVMDKYL